MRLKKDEIALIFAHGIVVKEGSIHEDDVIKCFKMAEIFEGAKYHIEEQRKHFLEIQKANFERICACGHKLKDGERIYDHGWQVGFECSRCA